ncbi:excalibur calcium-binding domain-containing protein [Weizmannia sp. FSL K6-0777]|uniref:excalibur calcium-binding domain-containing protein n=1 Tax=Heyndrickxia TaxID=2837504 RepID=UPI002E1DD3CF|nr:excalibur calcium-binding domain-containing protein [Weizmannia sp. CD-2023]
MKKLVSVVLAFGLIFGVSLSATYDVNAKTVKYYKNCKGLNKDYKGGVAKNSKVKNKGGKTHYKPYVSTALYNANHKLDRDKDGIACER